MRAGHWDQAMTLYAGTDYPREGRRGNCGDVARRDRSLSASRHGPVRPAQGTSSERWAPDPLQDLKMRRLRNAMRIMCEFTNKSYGCNDGDLIDDYRYGECKKPEIIQMILDTVPMERVPLEWRRQKSDGED